MLCCHVGPQHRDPSPGGRSRGCLLLKLSQGSYRADSVIADCLADDGFASRLGAREEQHAFLFKKRRRVQASLPSLPKPPS
jgi:hypothetical protein